MILSQGSRIEECATNGIGGAGFLTSATLSIIGGSSIRWCTAFDGGGLAVDSAFALLTESSVSDCTASAQGGAFRLRGAHMTLRDATVRASPGQSQLD